MSWTIALYSKGFLRRFRNIMTIGKGNEDHHMSTQKIECDINLLKSPKDLEGFYSQCVLLIIESDISEEKKEEWIQRIYFIATNLLKKGKEQLNFFSLSVAKVIQSTRNLAEKKRWVVFLQEQTISPMNQEGEKENFYAMCVIRAWNPSLPEAENRYWASFLESLAASSLDKKGQRENFYSMISMMVADSTLPHSEKKKYFALLDTFLKKYKSGEREHILSYCVVRMARKRGLCPYMHLLMDRSSDPTDFKKRSEDLIFDLFFGEKALHVLFTLQSCYEKK
jgi:hypothetical protein